VDNGKGIARKFLPHVFERFRQEDGSSRRTHNGLGIGLAITKSLTSASMEGVAQGALRQFQKVQPARTLDVTD